jgi:hypothetical protein
MFPIAKFIKIVASFGGSIPLWSSRAGRPKSRLPHSSKGWTTKVLARENFASYVARLGLVVEEIKEMAVGLPVPDSFV